MTTTIINTERFEETIRYITDVFESGSGLTSVNRSMWRPAVTKSTNDCLCANRAVKMT